MGQAIRRQPDRLMVVLFFDFRIEFQIDDIEVAELVRCRFAATVGVVLASAEQKALAGDKMPGFFSDFAMECLEKIFVAIHATAGQNNAIHGAAADQNLAGIIDGNAVHADPVDIVDAIHAGAELWQTFLAHDADYGPCGLACNGWD